MATQNSLYEKDVRETEVMTGDVVDTGAMTEVVIDNADQLHRRLNNRQIQLIAVGGAVGTALFISIGGALTRGGPLNLLLAYTIYSVNMAFVNSCIAEMTVMHPVSGGFVRMAGKAPQIWAEAILHATVYCGVPSGVEAMKTAERVFNEMKADGEKERELDGQMKTKEQLDGFRIRC
ncbi:uncharacterized protein Z518_00489 [Rhinocladiella mackenziei CBS 650.93]|uniref:Amino acid permease/ SLC12A domain-containing protein n=1 Tax=Rhinocladiella mackenziei CBS 650.93 TaxID=1442369 RepID=A0A0D2ITJ6_9EURO|nr:uncharacterized protein Z518_00489 [Rhinocladiella mackenziei CBS 650.93]KIX09409.1 hypothetical protein Z518_00489 [Rhinocladiella mackenziei CBS 650.93]